MQKAVAFYKLHEKDQPRLTKVLVSNMFGVAYSTFRDNLAKFSKELEKNLSSGNLTEVRYDAESLLTTSTAGKFIEEIKRSAIRSHQKKV